MLEEMLKSAKDGEHIKIKSGRYFIKDTIKLKNKKNVVVEAEDDVYFDGGIVISADCVKTYKGNIKVIDLAEYHLNLAEYGTRGFRRSYINAPNELFVNGKPYRVSCYPKGKTVPYVEGDIKDSGSRPSHYEYDNRSAVINIRDERLLSFADEEELTLPVIQSTVGQMNV